MNVIPNQDKQWWSHNAVCFYALSEYNVFWTLLLSLTDQMFFLTSNQWIKNYIGHSLVLKIPFSTFPLERKGKGR